MKIRPVKRLTISDEIAKQIRGLIANGILKPGDRLPPELELAESFDASRSSVREGLKALSYVGLIERTKEGTFVTDDPFRSVTDPMIFKLVFKKITLETLYDARKIIEVPLAGLAAERRDKGDLKEMEKCIAFMTAEVEHPEQFGIGGVDFHLAIAAASQNNILYEFMYAIRNLQMISNKEVVQSEEIFNQTLRYHNLIYDAIKSSDVQGAKNYMLEHILNAEQELRKLKLL